MMRSTILALACMLGLAASAQEQSSSSAVMSRGPRTRPGQTEATAPGVSARMQARAGESTPDRPDASMKYMRVIYRELDLESDDANAPLYFPEDLTDGNENLFRIMFRLLAKNQIPAYEYLDGREEFTEENRVKMTDLIQRFEITATPAKGFSEKNQVYDIEPVDVPTNQVLAYYIIERWEFDNRSNAMKTTVEAICPVVVRDDSYAISGRTPMFWMRMADLKPYLQQQYIFTDDDNNLASHTYDDFFTLGMYHGDIYKTRNLRNRTLAQIVGDDADLIKHAQDSIQNRLDHYADNLWVPSREELAAAREAAELAADSTATEEPATARSARSRSSRGSARSTREKPRRPKVRRQKEPKTSTPSSSATRSVRNRRR